MSPRTRTASRDAVRPHEQPDARHAGRQARQARQLQREGAQQPAGAHVPDGLRLRPPVLAARCRRRRKTARRSACRHRSSTRNGTSRWPRRARRVCSASTPRRALTTPSRRPTTGRRPTTSRPIFVSATRRRRHRARPDVEAMKKANGKVPTTGIVIPNVDVDFSNAVPGRRLRPVARELPEDPDRRRSEADRHRQGSRVPVLRSEPRPDPRPGRHRRLDERPPAGAPRCQRRPAKTPGRSTTRSSFPTTSQSRRPTTSSSTAKMQLRHLPPYFVTGLAKEQQDILGQGFNVPDGARIFDDDEPPRSARESAVAHVDHRGR